MNQCFKKISFFLELLYIARWRASYFMNYHKMDKLSRYWCLIHKFWLAGYTVWINEVRAAPIKKKKKKPFPLRDLTRWGWVSPHSQHPVELDCTPSHCKLLGGRRTVPWAPTSLARSSFNNEWVGPSELKWLPESYKMSWQGQKASPCHKQAAQGEVRVDSNAKGSSGERGHPARP